MRKSFFKIISLTILFTLIIGSHYSSLAKIDEIQEEKIIIADNKTNNKKKNPNLPTDIMDSNIINKFNPEKNQSDAVNSMTEPVTSTITKLVQQVLKIIQIIGGIFTVISVALFGFGMVVRGNPSLADDLGLDSIFFKGGGDKPDVRKQLLDFGRLLLIGSVLLFASSTIVQAVMGNFFAMA